MRASTIVDLKRLTEMIRATDMNTIHSHLLNCLPSLPNMPDLLQFENQLKASLHSLDLSSVRGWHVVQLLNKCLPEQLSIYSNSQDNVLVSFYSSALKLWIGN